MKVRWWHHLGTFSQWWLSLRRFCPQLNLTFEMLLEPCGFFSLRLIHRLFCQAMEETMAQDGQKFRFLIDGFPRNADNLEGWNREMDGKADVKFVLFFDCGNEVRPADQSAAPLWHTALWTPCLISAPAGSTGLHSEVFRPGEGEWANGRQQRKFGKKVKLEILPVLLQNVTFLLMAI